MKNKNKKIYASIIIYLIICLGVRALYLYQFSFSPLLETPLGADVQEYCKWAMDIVAGRYLWPHVKIHAPLYPMFLAFLYSIFSNIQNSFLFIRGSQILLGFLAIIPLSATIILINRENKDKNNSNLITFLIIWGIYPPLIYYLGELTSEVLIIPLLSTAIYLLYKGDSLIKKNILEKKQIEEKKDKENSNKSESDNKHPSLYLALAGLCAGLASIAHPLALFFLFSELIYLFLRKNLKGMFAFGILAFLVISPITIYNVAVLKEAVPIQANGGFNLYLGNNEDANGTCKLRPGPEWDAFHLGADRRSRELGISKDSLLIQKTILFIIKNPLQWLKLLGQKSLLVWNNKELTAGADLYPLRYFTTFQRLFTFSFGICAVFALIAIFANFKNSSFYVQHRHILILIGAFWLAQTLLVTSGRYRIAMVPSMLILTSWTLTHILSFIKSKKINNKTITSPGGIKLTLSLIAAIAIVYIPQAPFNLKQEQGEADTILGEAYLINQNYSLAEKHLLSAREKNPSWSRNYILLGMLKEKQHQDDIALKYYLKAIALDPSSANGFMNIAVWFSMKGKNNTAADFFEKAFSLRTKPSADLYYNYALFCYNNGNRKKAFKSYIKCIKINPSHEMALNNLGIIFFMAGKYPEAIIYFQKVLKLNPKNAQRIVNLASAKFAIGKNKEALDLTNKALEISPELLGAKELKKKILKNL